MKRILLVLFTLAAPRVFSQSTQWGDFKVNGGNIIGTQNVLNGYATTATAAGTTTLTNASTGQQYFTGSSTQNCKLPVVSTLVLGQSYAVVNNSSGVVTVQSSGGNTIQAMQPSTQLIATVISLSGTGAASWAFAYSPQALSPMTTLGDIVYEDSTPTPVRLPGNTTATTKFLSQTGTGSISAAPSWIQPACSNLSNAAASCSTDTTNASNITTGTLGGTVQGNITTVGTIASGTWSGTTIAVNKGGTGITSGTSGGIPYYSGSTSIASSGALTAHAVVLGGGAGATPTAVSGLGNTGDVLTSNGTGVDPTFQTPAGGSGGYNSPDGFTNVGWSTSVGSNILTIALKQADGSTNPSSGTAAVSAYFRSSTATSGGYSSVSQTSSLSLAITQGTTLGLVDSVAKDVWFYLINNAGTMKLGVSSVQVTESQLQSTIAESFSATATNASPCVFTANGHGMSNGNAVRITGTPPTGFSTGTTYYLVSKAANTFQLSASPGGSAINSSSTGTSVVIHVADFSLVSDAVYSNVAVRLLGRGNFTESTTGSWASNATLVHAGKQPFETIAANIGGAAANVTANNPVIYPTIGRDTHGAYNASTGLYVVPATGFYLTTLFNNSVAAIGTSIYLSVDANTSAGVNRPVIGVESTTNGGFAGAGVTYATALQTLSLRPSGSLTSFDVSTTASFERIGP